MMGILSNARHERFAQNIAKGMNATEAYREAGYTAKGNAAEVNASKLLRHAKVRARIAELQNKAAERTIKTIEDIVSQLDEDRALARANGQASAAVSATMGQAKILGLITDKHRVVGITYEEALDALDAEEPSSRRIGNG